MKLTYISLTLLIPAVAFGMEMQNVSSESTPLRQPNEIILLDLEAGHSAAKLSADLVKSIKLGKTSHVNALLTKRTNRSVGTQDGTAQSMDQIVSALGFTEGELELQQQQMSQRMFDHFMARYKQAAVPMLLTALSIVNMGTNAYYFANPASAAAQQNTGSFGVNMAASGASALGFGYESYLQIRKGWTDHRQKKLVEHLKNSQLLLELLKKNAMADGVITPQEQAVIDAALTDHANLQKEVAQAQVNAQNADAAIAANAANNNNAAPVAQAPAPAPVVVAAADGNNNNNNNDGAAPAAE